MKCARFFAGGLVLSAFGLFGFGCERTPVTEYVAGFSTQVQVPKEFRTIEFSVTAYSALDPIGVVTECQFIEVVDGRARLPKTLGVQRQTEAPNVMVSIAAYREDVQTVREQIRITDCDGELPAEARVLRRSRQHYRDGRILYLPMPLKYACFDHRTSAGKHCPDGETCMAGQCVPVDRNPLIFRDYSPELGLGDSSVCFSLRRCMSDAITPTLEDAATCTYSVPGTLDGMNVRAIYDGFVTEVLDVDLDSSKVPGFDALTPEEQKAVTDDLAAHQEGYTVVGPGKFRLAPGLCALTKPENPGPRQILALLASRACPPKPAEQPICDEGSEVLIPAPSRLYVLIDRSTPMASFLGENAIEEILKLSFGDPVFSTTDIAVKWLPGPAAEVCESPASSYVTPDLPFAKALATRDALIDGIAAQGTSPRVASASPFLALTQEGAYTAILKDKDGTDLPRTSFNQLAVVLITNNAVGEDCGGAANGGPVAAAKAQAEQLLGARTYVIQLGQSGQTAVDDPDRLRRVEQCRSLAIAGGTAVVKDGVETCFDATLGSTEDDEKKARLAGVASEAFNRIVSQLSSCVYERPGTITDGATTKITFVGPTGFRDILFEPGCTPETQATANGWNFDPANSQFVRICGSACEEIRMLLEALSPISAQAQSVLTETTVLPQPVLITATQGK